MMRSELPEELHDALKALETAEKKILAGYGIVNFTEALASMREYACEYPSYKIFIENIIYSYIRRIIDILCSKQLKIDFDSWYCLTLALFVWHKESTARVVKQNNSLKPYLENFLALYSDKSPSELRPILSEILDS